MRKKICMTVFFLCGAFSFVEASEIDFVCRGAYGSETKISTDVSGKKSTQLVDVQENELVYFFHTDSSDPGNLFLSIDSPEVISPKNEVSKIPILDKSGDRIVAIDRAENEIWIYIIYIKSKTALYFYSMSSAAFSEKTTASFFASCQKNK